MSTLFPSAAPVITVSELNKQGLTVLLVEQNARMALRAANRAYVLEAGRVALSGAGAALLEDDQLTMAYLGGRGEGKVPTACQRQATDC